MSVVPILILFKTFLNNMKICLILMVIAGVAAQTEDVRFYIFTSKSQIDPVQIDSTNATKYIKSNGAIIVLIHGWNQNRTIQWYKDLKEALFSRGEYTIIETDYAKIGGLLYPLAVRKSRSVGSQIGDFINNLRKQGISLKNFHIIGHSLGGQIAGYIGSYLFDKTSKKLPRITALDPAGPLFQPPLNISGYAINKNCAHVVVVIHTDRHFFGYNNRCGTVDIFPNGGSSQPGCPNLDSTLFCSHHTSYMYFTYAIAHPKSIFATRCNSYQDFLGDQCKKLRKIDLGGKIGTDDAGLYYFRGEIGSDDAGLYYFHNK